MPGSGVLKHLDRTAYLKKRVKEEFDESRDTYGQDKIIAELHKKADTSDARDVSSAWPKMNLDYCHNRHISNRVHRCNRVKCAR